MTNGIIESLMVSFTTFSTLVQYILDYPNLVYLNLDYPNKVVPKKSRFSERFLVYPNHSNSKQSY